MSCTYRVAVSCYNQPSVYLYVEQPRLEFLHSLHEMCDIPHDQIEGASRQETLVSGVVLLLTTKVPRHERDALQRCLTLSHLTVVCPVTHHNPHSANIGGGRDILQPILQ